MRKPSGGRAIGPHMKTLLKLIVVLLGVFSCRSDKEFSELLIDLENQEDSVRLGAIESLEDMKLSDKQRLCLLQEATKDFPPAKYEWQSIPGILVEKATRKPSIALLPVIKDNYKDYDRCAKNEALRYLSGYDDSKAITLYKECALEYPCDIEYLPVGVLNKNFRYKSILFPDMLKLFEQESTGSDVLSLFLDYLNAGQLDPIEYASYTDMFVSLSEKYRKITVERQRTEVDLWEDGDYQNARYKSGLVADLLCYFENHNVINELEQYSQLSDNKLRMFAALSLVKLGREIDSESCERIAADSECRKWFYDNLVELDKASMFPEKYRTQEAFAESDMINWLLFPTELGRLPDSIELMRIVEVDSRSEDGVVEFYLFRFKSEHEDWKENGWMAGVSGYFPKKEKPSTSGYGYTFSSFEKWDSRSPDEHIQEIRDLIEESFERHG